MTSKTMTQYVISVLYPGDTIWEDYVICYNRTMAFEIAGFINQLYQKSTDSAQLPAKLQDSSAPRFKMSTRETVTSDLNK